MMLTHTPHYKTENSWWRWSVGFATSKEEDNKFPYGTAEHLAHEMGNTFGGTIGAFTISLCFRTPRVSIEEYLDGVLTLYGVKEAQYGALYLQNFETMPELMDSTKEQIVLMNLDFDEDTDPDLRRFDS
jgi:hypothetical protein